jgi:hypothetical protein
MTRVCAFADPCHPVGAHSHNTHALPYLPANPMNKRNSILVFVALVLIAAALIYARPWESSNPLPAPATQSTAPDPTELFTSPKSGKKHALAEYKPAPGKPGWVICPDTNQQIPLVSLKR